MDVPIFIHTDTFGIQPGCQLLIGSWMKVPAQVQKILFRRHPRQSQFFRPFTNPLTGNLTTFHVIITNAQVFAKI